MKPSQRSKTKASQAGQAAKTRRTKNTAYASALKSFIGHLEGTGKAAHTIDSYRLDLLRFEEFLRGEGNKPAEVRVDRISRKDLERYHEHLKLEGQKTNTRRRKLMTVRKLMTYLASRKRIEIDVAKKLPAPAKIERIPFTVDSGKLIEAIRGLETGTPILARNRALLWLLAETGCSVAEAAALRWKETDLEARRVEFLGKSQRTLSISAGLANALGEVVGSAKPHEPCFRGFNRFGSLGGAITPRGIELLVKSYEPKLGLGSLTPRSFRHSIVVHWYREGTSESEIQKRLGLKTAYSFRVYAPIFAKIAAASKSTTGPTSSG